MKTTEEHENIIKQLEDYKASGGVLEYIGRTDKPNNGNLPAGYLAVDLGDILETPKAIWDSIG